MTAKRDRARVSLAVRLIGGSVAAAVVAVFVLAGLTLWRTKHTVGQLAKERQQAVSPDRGRWRPGRNRPSDVRIW